MATSKPLFIVFKVDRFGFCVSGVWVAALTLDMLHATLTGSMRGRPTPTKPGSKNVLLKVDIALVSPCLSPPMLHPATTLIASHVSGPLAAWFSPNPERSLLGHLGMLLETPPPAHICQHAHTPYALGVKNDRFPEKQEIPCLTLLRLPEMGNRPGGAMLFWQSLSLSFPHSH